MNVGVWIFFNLPDCKKSVRTANVLTFMKNQKLRLAMVGARRGIPINGYDAVTWSCLTPLSEASIAGGNIPVKALRFQEGVR